MPCLRLWGCYDWHIEETFLDDKSNGFELERSRLRDEKKLERLCLVLAIATLFLSAQGVAVVESRLRWRSLSAGKSQVDVHSFRGNSYFRIGWDWLRRSLVIPLSLLTTTVRFLGHFNVDPVLPSLKALHKRFSLDFSIIKLPTRRSRRKQQ